MKPLSNSIKQIAITQFHHGKSIHEVARALSISIRAAHKIRRAIKEHIPVNKPGRPSKVSGVTKRVLARQFDIGQLGTLQEGQRFVQSTEGVHVDERTIRAYLSSENVDRYLKQKRTDLTDDQKSARMKFAEEHLHWSLEDWKNVMFSDETLIYRIEARGRRSYYKKCDTNYIRPHHSQRTKQGGGGKILFWGCITYYGVGYASKLDQGLDSDTYIEVLKDYVFSSRDWYGIDPGKFIFQHDNASIHTANIVKNYIKKSKIPIMVWPANSPDLNLIETIWAYLKDQLGRYSQDAKDIDELWERIQDIWNNIPEDLIHKLYESMPRRMQAVMQSKGEHIRY